MENEFVNWYEKKAMHYSMTEIGQFYPYIDMEHLIWKIVMWYEFKYSDDLIDSRDNKSKDVLTRKVLLESLPWFERIYFLDTRYTNMVKIWKDKSVINIFLDRKGYVVDGDNSRYLVDELEGLHIRDVIKYIEDNGLGYDVSLLKKAIVNYEIQVELKKRLMEAIVERMIGFSVKYGMKRAVYFGLEFDLEMDILEKYMDDKGRGMLERIKEHMREGKKLVK